MTIVGMHAHVRDRVHGGGGGGPWNGPRAAMKIAKGAKMSVLLRCAYLHLISAVDLLQIRSLSNAHFAQVRCTTCSAYPCCTRWTRTGAA